MNSKFRSLLISFVTLCGILAVSFAVISYGRGYRIDIRQNSLTPTGLVSVTSDPVGAEVLVDGTLKTATNNSLSVKPGWYTISIEKEGYIPWQKHTRVQGEVVSRADAFLFPANPSLTPLTTLGITQPILSPDGGKIAYIVPRCTKNSENKEVCIPAARSGLWIYELSEGPLGRNRDAIQLAPIDTAFNITDAALTWSPDSSQILAVSRQNVARLYSTSRPGTIQPFLGTYQTLLDTWTDELREKQIQQLTPFDPQIVKIATESATILSLSPDETKILYQATASAILPDVIIPPLIGTNPTEQQREITAGNLYVYDVKEDKNYLVLQKSELPKGIVLPAFIHWFPTSRHLMLTLPGKIDVMEYDRTNWVTIYSGPFEDGFVAPWSNGSRIIIMTNLNADASTLPNLYTVNLR